MPGSSQVPGQGNPKDSHFLLALDPGSSAKLTGSFPFEDHVLGLRSSHNSSNKREPARVVP